MRVFVELDSIIELHSNGASGVPLPARTHSTLFLVRGNLPRWFIRGDRIGLVKWACAFNEDNAKVRGDATGVEEDC